MLSGEIRLIKYGIIPNLPTFNISVNQVVGGVEQLTVKQIVREVVGDSKFIYHIECVKKDSKGEFGLPFVWKTYYKEPDEVQYFVPDEKHNYLKV